VVRDLPNICGSHVFFYESTKIRFVLTGKDDCIVRIQQIKTVMLSLRVEMDLDTFYATNGPTTFIDKMSAFLGIPPDKLRIVSIVKGSVKIKFEVIMDEETQKAEKIKQLTTPANTTATNT